jgi:hypothetical protein
MTTGGVQITSQHCVLRPARHPPSHGWITSSCRVLVIPLVSMVKRFLQTLLLVDIQMDWVLLVFNHRRLDSFLVIEPALNCYRSSDWCMVESLNWIGSDVIRPDCSVDPTDPSCSNPANVTADNQRIANLYDDTVLCSECFMKLFYEKLGSDFLPDSDHSDYLVDQFQDIQDVCSTTIGSVSTRGFSGYPPSTPTPELVNITAPNPNTTTTYAISTASATSSLLASPTTSSVVTPTPTHGSIVSNCNSFYYAVANDTCYDIALDHNITLIDFGTWNSVVGVNCTGLWADYFYCVGITLDTTSRACQMIDTTTGVSSTDDFTACNQLAVLYNVPTGSLISITGATDCYSATDVCVPAACNLMNVTEGATW